MRVALLVFCERARRRAWGAALVGAVILLGVLVPGFLSVPALADPSPSSTTSAALTVNWSAPTRDLATTFWGTDVRPYATVNASLAGEWNATPLGYVVWPGGRVAEGYNYSSGVITNPGGGTYKAPETTPAFVHWCRQVACHSIFQVPAEIDQPAVAAYYVAYTEKTLGYHPDYWEIGNEPAGWNNFGVPWSKWGSVSGTGITAQGYAQLVHRFIPAMRAVDPAARIIGLPGTGIGASQETTWLGDTVALNGPNLSAVAIHVYPAGTGSGTPTLSGFFGSLIGKGSLSHRVPSDLAAIRSACPSCGPLPLFVTESGAGISGGIWDTYMSTYPDVPYMAAQVVQAISLGVANLDLFSFEGAYPGSLFTGSGSPLPVYTFYSSFLSRLGPAAVSTALTTSAQGAYAQLTVNSTSGTLGLLVVNANASNAIDLPLTGVNLSSGVGPVTLLAWNESQSGPSMWYSSSGLPGSVTVPAASVLLITAPYSGPSETPALFPVQFSATGLPSGESWSVNLAGDLLAGTSSTLSTTLANGSYSFVVNSPASWTADPSGGTLVVAGSAVNQAIVFSALPSTPENYTVSFVPDHLSSAATWSVTLGASVLHGNGTLAFSEPNGTYSFSVGAPNGTRASPANGSVTVAGASQELQINLSANPPSVTMYRAEFVPSGLPGGDTWQVSLGSGALSGSGPLDFWVPNGTYGFQVAAPSLFTADPSVGTVTVAGGNQTIPVALSENTSTGPGPATPVYNVSFVPEGLPSHTVWSVSLGPSLVESSAGVPINFTLANGSYAYVVSAVSGYAPSVPTGVFVVQGGGWTFNVSYVAAVPSTVASPGPTSLALGQLLEPVVRSWLLLTLLAVVAVLSVAWVERRLLRLRRR